MDHGWRIPYCSRVGTQNTYGKEVGTEQCANLIGKRGSNCGWEAGV